MLKINFSALSTKSLDNLAHQTIELSKANNHADVVNNPLFAVLENDYARYHEVVIKQSFAGMGKEIRESDFFRDRVYRGTVRSLQGIAAILETTRGKAAAKLLKVFTDVGNIKGLSYADENTVLQKLTATLDKPENKALASELHLEEEIALLIQAHADFVALYQKQIDATSDLRQMETASSLRNTLQEALRNFYAYVSALRNTGSWKDIYSDLNELIKKTKS